MRSKRLRKMNPRTSVAAHGYTFSPLTDEDAYELCGAIVTDAVRNISFCLLPPYVTEPIMAEVESLRSMPFDWFLTKGPALARELSSALALNSEEQLSTEFLHLFGTFAYFFRCMCVFGRVSFSPSGAPRGFESLESNTAMEDSQRVMQDRKEFARLLLQIREVLGLFSRLTRETSSDTHDVALRDAVARLTATPQIELPNSFQFVGEQLLGQLDLSFLQSDGEECPWKPKHGPGSCAEFQRWDPTGSLAYRSAWKHAWKESFRWLEDPLRCWVRQDWFRPIFPSSDVDPLSGVSWSGCDGEKSSRLYAVPKDYRGPRIIAMEPVMHQYIQQAVFQYFLEYCRYHSLGRAVNLLRSDLNARDALKGSEDGSIATIDLSDASDYVRVYHVQQMTRRLPILQAYLMALRTSSVRLGTEEFEITTFAPMGSALCPPMQSAFYACLIISSYLDETAPGQIVTAGSVVKALKKLQLRCYNDDIIVDTKFANLVISAFEKAGLKPNRSKCCTTGRFRESCGTDAWFGHDVTPIRPRHLPGSSDQSLSGHLDTVSNLWMKGFNSASALLLRLVQEKCVKKEGEPVPFQVPVLDGFERVPGCVSMPGCAVLQQHDTAFWDKALQRPAVRTFVERPVLSCRRDPLHRALREALARNCVSQRSFSGYATGQQRIKLSTVYLPRAAHTCEVENQDWIPTWLAL